MYWFIDLLRIGDGGWGVCPVFCHVMTTCNSISYRYNRQDEGTSSVRYLCILVSGVCVCKSVEFKFRLAAMRLGIQKSYIILLRGNNQTRKGRRCCLGSRNFCKLHCKNIYVVLISWHNRKKNKINVLLCQTIIKLQNLRDSEKLMIINRPWFKEELVRQKQKQKKS